MSGAVTSPTVKNASGTRAAGLVDHRRRRIDTRDEAVRDRIAEQRGREARAATHVDDVAVPGAGKLAEQRARRARERVGDERESFASEIGIAEGVRGHTVIVARAVAAASRLFSITTPSLDPSSGSEARSGCGIRPTTLPSALQMPAMSSRLPLGLST